jgi:dUTP pyrophosphatase
MILPGSKIAEGKLVSDVLGDSQVQPAGCDLTLREAHSIDEAGEVDFDNSKRKISKTTKIEFDSGGLLRLKQGCYKIVYNEYVNIPLDCAAFGYPRSSLLRCGADVRCAVWDPGYHGIVLHKNAKVMQLVFVRLEGKAEKGYEGQYKGENK